MKSGQPPCTTHPPLKLPQETFPDSFNLNFMPKKEIKVFIGKSTLSDPSFQI